MWYDKNIMNSAKLILWGGVVVIFGVVYFLWGDRENVPRVTTENPKIVAFGDSLVEGVGATEGNDFVSVVARDLRVSIVNKGKRGDTTAMGLARVDDVLAENPGVVVLLFGGNDVLRRIPKETTFENMEMIIERLQGGGSMILLLGVQGGVLGDGYEAKYRILAKKYKTAYISNVLEGLIGRTEYMSDGIHPNDRGYAQIVLRVAPVLREMVKSSFQ
jgi:lysophospholipase L1-like esterase